MLEDDTSSVSTDTTETAEALRSLNAEVEEYYAAGHSDYDHYPPWLEKIVTEAQEGCRLQRKLERAGLGKADESCGRAVRGGTWYSKRIEQKQARRNMRLVSSLSSSWLFT